MISEISKPTITVKEIEITPYGEGANKSAKEYWEEKYGIRINELGKEPIVWYNGIYIPPYLIESFYLQSNEFLPSLQIYFRDETYEMINKGLAMDNTIISIYIDSRTKDTAGSPVLRPIRMDFKIMKYDYMEDKNLFYIYGLPDIDNLYIQSIKSYPQKTSFETLKSVASFLKLGFRSNVQGTSDTMTWLNMSLENHQFIKNTTDRAYKGDNSFFTSFIDFYYSLNFVDVEQSLKESLEQKGVLTSSSEGMEEADTQKIENLYIISSRYYENRYNNMYESYEVMNQSTEISLDNGYKTIIHYYDRTANWEQRAGTFLRFTLETNTDGKGIILKGTPNDTSENSFFNKNIKREYIQPLDIDNTHKNFNFAFILNQYNNTELDKVSIKVTMRDPNFNFYKYQKIRVVVMSVSAGNELVENERLSGGWMIKSINFFYSPKKGVKQELIMIKRELSAGDFNF